MADLGLPEKMLLIMASVMVVLGLADYAISETSGAAFFDFEHTAGGRFTDDGSLTGNFIAGYDDSSAVAADTVEEDTGNVFTDTFKSLRSWWEKLERRFGLASSILSQPAGFLKEIGIPLFIVNAFGIVWYMMAAMAVMMFFTGR